MDRARDRNNVPGPFYVEHGCCTMCGVPEALAPDLFGSDERPHCFVKRQPESQAEIDRMIRVMWTAELGCIRYGADDVAIRRRLAELGKPNLCDVPPPDGAWPYGRDHAAVSTAHPALRSLGADQLALLFSAYFSAESASNRVRWGQRSPERSEILVSWFEERFHRVTIQALDRPDARWLITHEGPRGLSLSIRDWLQTEKDCSLPW